MLGSKAEGFDRGGGEIGFDDDDDVHHHHQRERDGEGPFGINLIVVSEVGTSIAG